MARGEDSGKKHRRRPRAAYNHGVDRSVTLQAACAPGEPEALSVRRVELPGKLGETQ